MVPELGPSRPFVDPGGLLAFWQENYLQDYLPAGGSAVKWLKGREGSGKTALLGQLRRAARGSGYLVAAISARDVQIGRMDEVYRRIVPQIPAQHLGKILARGASDRLGVTLDLDRPDASLERTFQEQGRPVAAAQSDLMRAFDFLYAERNIAPPVASALRRIAEPHVQPSAASEEATKTALAWLQGERVLATARRRAGIGMALDRFRVRDVLRSLLFAIQLCGGAGLVLTVDDLDALISTGEGVKYTRLRREDAYEGIRELIDDGARMPGLMAVYAGRPEVFLDERAGLRSYAALAMRVENEVQTGRPNLFNDVQDLDELWQTDWPQHRLDLARAYGTSAGAVQDVEARAFPTSGAVSPVKRLVEAWTSGSGGDALAN